MIGDQRQCACGSGLRPARCCQMEAGALGPPEAARPLLPMVERAAELFARQNAVDDARQICLNALELAPGQLDALTLLYRIRKAQRRRPRPRRCCGASWLSTRTRSGRPTSWPYCCSAGAIFEAEHHARNAIRIAPDNPQSHNLMGMVMTEANRAQVGEYHYRKVIELSGGREPVVLSTWRGT